MMNRIYSDIENLLEPGKALIICWPRQVGKTTLIKAYLETTQFQILYSLASNPGRIHSRDAIISHVYTDSEFHGIYDRTIDAHIKSIRKIIEDEASTPYYIKTVISRRYLFSPS